jgi:glucosamine 6-phosphate synthetase-like amidotransferase/phosphosugar isomerase protein
VKLPLALKMGKGEFLICSDLIAKIEVGRNQIPLDNGAIML